MSLFQSRGAEASRAGLIKLLSGILAFFFALEAVVCIVHYVAGPNRLVLDYMGLVNRRAPLEMFIAYVIGIVLAVIVRHLSGSAFQRLQHMDYLVSLRRTRQLMNDPEYIKREIARTQKAIEESSRRREELVERLKNPVVGGNA